MPAPNGSDTAINGADQGEEFSSRCQCIESLPERIQLTEAREHPVEQLRLRKERGGLGDNVCERGVEEHGGEADVAVVCGVVVTMRTLSTGKDDEE